MGTKDIILLPGEDFQLQMKLMYNNFKVASRLDIKTMATSKPNEQYPKSIFANGEMFTKCEFLTMVN